MKKITILIALFLLVYTAQAQNQFYSALIRLNNTQFMLELDSIRNKSEEEVRTLKRNKHKYTEEEVAELMEAYDQSVDRFNAIVLNLKADLQQKETRNFLVKYPAKYSKQVMADLHDAEDYYANAFVKTTRNITEDETYGAGIMTLLPMLFQYAPQVVEIFKGFREKMKAMNINMLNKHLVEKHRFRTWEEIE